MPKGKGMRRQNPKQIQKNKIQIPKHNEEGDEESSRFDFF